MQAADGVRRRMLALVSMIVLAGVAVALDAGGAGTSDPDGLYHLRHAWIYRTQGLFQHEFPWAAFSAIGREGADLWYGFHVLLVPFVLGDDPLAGLSPASVAITFACLALVWTAMRRLGVRFALFWTLVCVFATGDLLFRVTMLRPHALSLGLALVLYALLCELRPSRVAVLATSAALGWIHCALFWLPVFVLGAVCGARWIVRGRPPFAAAGWAALGFAAGTLARPNPIGAIRLSAVQIATWLAGRGGGQLAEVGRELRPFTWVQFQNQLLALTALVVVAIVLLALEWRERKRDRDHTLDRERAVKLVSAFVLLCVFAAMTFAVARRANDLLVVFAVVFAALAAGPAVARRREARFLPRAVALLAAAAAIAWMPVRSVYWLNGYRSTVPSVDRLRDASLWLHDHAQDGDLVFHPHWDQFHSLFFWNQRCRYVNGHDPVFLYVFDPQRYRIVQQLEQDNLLFRGRDAGVLDGDVPRDLRGVIRDLFGAKWVLVRKTRTPQMAEWLRNDSGFPVAFETSGELICRVLP